MRIFNLFLLLTFISCGAHKQFNESQSGVSDRKEIRKDESLEGQIQDAIIKEDLNLIEQIILNGQNINGELKNGRTPLTEACEWRKWNSLKKLLSLGADLNLTDKFNKTTIDYATNSPQLKRILNPALETLLENHILDTIKNKKTLQLKKYLEDEIPNLNFYLDYAKHGAQIDELDQGQTLLTWLVTKKNELIIRTLTLPKYQLDLNLKNKQGEAPLKMAKNLSYTNIELLLTKLGAYE